MVWPQRLIGLRLAALEASVRLRDRALDRGQLSPNRTSIKA